MALDCTLPSSVADDALQRPCGSYRDDSHGCIARNLGVRCEHQAATCSDPVANLAAACSRRLHKGQHLFWAGDRAAQIWLVREGALKTYRISADGEQRVAGFFFAGDVLGWDALACGSFQFNAMALESTTVARLPAAVVLTDALQSSQVQTRLLDGMRTEFQRLDSMLWLEHHSADARLAAFLLCIADAQMRNSGGRDDINLPMPRRDIGSYLGLTTETVSRRLSLFHRHDWITLEHRHIHIKQLQQLQQLSES